MNDWIPVSERLPNEEEFKRNADGCESECEFIVMIAGAKIPTTLYYTKDGEWKDNEDYKYDVIAWMNLPEPYIPQTDWSKVPIDTKILVSNDGETWYKRYFAKYDNGKIYAWDNGYTSWITNIKPLWKYAKLYEGDK